MALFTAYFVFKKGRAGADGKQRGMDPSERLLWIVVLIPIAVTLTWLFTLMLGVLK